MALAITTSKSSYRAGSLLYPAVHHVQAEQPVPHLASAGQTGLVSWSDSAAGGTFSPLTGPSVDYLAANGTRAVTIVATDSGAGGSGSTIIVVTATFPIQPQVDYDIDLDDETRVQYMRDRTAYFQIESDAFEDRPLAFLDRITEERDTLRQFWMLHRKTLSFFYIDVETSQTYLAKFTSGLKIKVRGANSYDMTCTISGTVLS